MSNVERLLKYTDTEPEAALIKENIRPPRNWPNTGKIQFRDLSMR